MTEYSVFILPDGTIRFIYDDSLKWLSSESNIFLKRASHIEANVNDNKVEWFADLSPVNGPLLGPFASREESIEAEKHWLHKYHLPCYSTISHI